MPSHVAKRLECARLAGALGSGVQSAKSHLGEISPRRGMTTTRSCFRALRHVARPFEWMAEGKWQMAERSFPLSAFRFPLPHIANDGFLSWTN
jgi:hypothetical protein